MLKIKHYLYFLMMTFALAACGGDDNDSDDDETPSSDASTMERLRDRPQYSTLVSLLEQTGLDTVLEDSAGSYTLFAPLNSAFDDLPQATLEALLADNDALQNVLLYHVITGLEADSAAAIGLAGTAVEMGNGQNLALSLSGSDLLANTVPITATDLQADNGVIHTIRSVLIPPAVKGEPTDNIVETAVAAGSFNTLVTALQAAGLDSALADEDATFTVFAPTDDAFAMLPAGVLTALLSDTDALTEVLLQHVIGDLEADSITAFTLNGLMVETLGGADIDVAIVDGQLTVGGATVTTADIYTSNGVIHVIDAVIVGDADVPQPSIIDVAEEVGGFETLLTALEATGLDVVLADMDETYTVFAPTDEAFSALGDDMIAALLADTDTLSDILLYHVISEAEVLSAAAVAVATGDESKVGVTNGDMVALSFVDPTLYVNTAAVTGPDVMAGNGVIHVVNQVLIPPADMGTPTDNIVETAVAAGSFGTLVTALQAAGLDTTLADEGETFTVFAPTDAAFDLIPEETLTALLADVPALTDVLLQHVIIGAAVDSVTAFTLNGTSTNTAADEDVTIAVVDGALQIQGSNITSYDIYTSNGVIHVIDAVITETLE